MSLTPNQAAELVRDAFIWGYPVVDNYRINHNYFIDETHPEYKAPPNVLTNICRLYTDQDRSLQTPNSDTPYSWCLADLREDGLVLTIPKLEHPDRYHSVQLIDLHCYNSDYISSRTVGTDGGNYLLVGPNWMGDFTARYPNIDKVYRLDSDFATLLYRTQLFNEADLKNVEKLQSGYLVTPYKDFELNNNCPMTTPSKDLHKSSAPLPNFIKPLTVPELSTRVVEFFRILNYALIWARIHPLDREYVAPFQQCGLILSTDELSDLRSNVQQGNFSMLKTVFSEPSFTKRIDKTILDAFPAGVKLAHDFQKQRMKQLDDRSIQSFMFFGNRAFIGNRYGDHMLGVIYGIYGQDKEEAIYLASFVDSDGLALSCLPPQLSRTRSTGDSEDDQKDDNTVPNKLKTDPNPDPSEPARYEYTFPANSLPPSRAFWSLTLYTMPDMFFYPNQYKKWLINDSMMDRFVFNKDGSLTILVQHEKPEREEMCDANWLPAPTNRPFWVILRCYSPTEDGWNGKWSSPYLINVTKHPRKSVFYQENSQHTSQNNLQLGLGSTSSTMQPQQHHNQ
jgi:hypothetical protein